MFSRHWIILLGLVTVAIAATPALAGKGGGHANSTATASCSAADGLVAATGLPTDEVINFMVTDTSGTWGWVLGTTSDGTWSVKAPAGAKYQFTGRGFGPGGSKYAVFASC